MSSPRINRPLTLKGGKSCLNQFIFNPLRVQMVHSLKSTLTKTLSQITSKNLRAQFKSQLMNLGVTLINLKLIKDSKPQEGMIRTVTGTILRTNLNLAKATSRLFFKTKKVFSE
jgi:hypothetical protein